MAAHSDAQALHLMFLAELQGGPSAAGARPFFALVERPKPPTEMPKRTRAAHQRAAARQGAEQRQTVRTHYPLGRQGVPEELAQSPDEPEASGPAHRRRLRELKQQAGQRMAPRRQTARQAGLRV